MSDLERRQRLLDAQMRWLIEHETPAERLRWWITAPFITIAVLARIAWLRLMR